MDVDMNTNAKNDMKNNDMMMDEGSYDDYVKGKKNIMDRRMRGWWVRKSGGSSGEVWIQDKDC